MLEISEYFCVIYAIIEKKCVREEIRNPFSTDLVVLFLRNSKKLKYLVYCVNVLLPKCFDIDNFLKRSVMSPFSHASHENNTIKCCLILIIS